MLRRSPGSVALLPLPAVPSDVHVLPEPMSHLYLELRLRTAEGFSRSRLGVLFADRLSDTLKRIL